MGYYTYNSENSSTYHPDESKGEVDYEKQRAKSKKTNEYRSGRKVALDNGGTRQYNRANTTYSDYDADGNQIGAGLSGTENWKDGNAIRIISQSSVPYSGSSGGASFVGGGSGGSFGATSSPSQSSYASQLTKYNNMIAEQAAKAKQDALRQAWESNQQGLNSQNATVTNNYQSAADKIKALQAARLPEFQQQRNSASADAAQTARRLREVMAASGRGDSGYSRSNQLSVDLNRSNALSGITSSQNQFTTDIGNQLSDVDSQRVAALNDIASKIQLGQKQYNDGTLSLTNQLESEKASGALKAMMDAQTWADQKAQQEFDNSLRQKQFEQSASLAQLQQAWQEKQFAADQEAQAFNQALQTGQLTGVYNGQSTLAAQAQAAEQAYRNAALARSGSSSGSSSANLSAMKYQDEQASQQALARSMQGLQAMANKGSTRSELLAYINSNAGDLQANGVPIQDLYKWASSNFTWDKDGDGWYNTAD